MRELRKSDPEPYEFEEEVPSAVIAPVEAQSNGEKKWWQFWKKNEEEGSTKPVPLYKLFRYAKGFDWLLITISLISAILHGCALPAAMYVFGDLTNLFFNHDISRQVFQNVQTNFSTVYGSFTFDETASVATIEEAVATATITPDLVATETMINQLIAFTLNTLNPSSNTSADSVSGLGCLIVTYANESIDNLVTPFQVFRELSTNRDYTLLVTTATCECVQTEFVNFNAEARCYSDHTFFFGLGGVDGILWMIYLFLVISGGVFLLGTVQITTIKMACERQIHRLRLVSYRSILHQDIGWFDLNDVGELANVLNDDIDKIHDGIGDKFSILVQWVATFFGGFAVGFIRGWQLALLLLALTPFMAFAATLFTSVTIT